MSLRRSARVQIPIQVNLKPDVDLSTRKKPAKAAHHVAEEEEQMPPPTTPNKRRKLANPPSVPPTTPTPSAIAFMTSTTTTTTTTTISTPQPPPTRHLNPRKTNAPLLTPGGTGIYSTFEDNASPSKPGGFIQTNKTLLSTACAHLISVDPTLAPIIQAHPCKPFSPEGLAEEIDPFRALASGIIAQQVSGAAAKSIKDKFVRLFTGKGDLANNFPTTKAVLAKELSVLRTAGLSQRKAEYIQGLAERFETGELSTEMLMEGSDDLVREKLVAVRGLGMWSVDMFMCFGLKRLDVFSTGDLGVQRGMAKHAGRDVNKLKARGGGKWKYMSEKDMLEISSGFSPYRSLFMWYMWRVEDVDVTAVQDN